MIHHSARGFTILRLGALLLAALIFAPAQGCDTNAPCGKCAEGEFSWNPGQARTTAQLNHFYELGDLIQKAYQNKDYTQAKMLAEENLKLAALYRCNWNYGNAIHDSHHILGLISVEKNDLDAAVEHLKQAGKSTGSPQLDSFGPDLDLAQILLRQGKTEAVKAYLVDIQSFWKMDEGVVDKWLTAIDKGETPELNRFSAERYGRSIVIWTVVAVGIFLWPLIASGIGLAIVWKRLSRKWLYLVASTLSGLALIFGINWAWSVMMPYLISKADGTNQIAIDIAVYSPFVLTAVFPALAAYGWWRYFSAREQSVTRKT